MRTIRLVPVLIAGLMVVTSIAVAGVEALAQSAPDEALAGTGTVVTDDFPGDIRVNQQNGLRARGDFSVGPARFLIPLSPGETQTVEFTLTNREGKRSDYRIFTEDFSLDPANNWALFLHGEYADGPYPARKWIVPETGVITLEHGQQAFIRVKVNVPREAQAGDHQAGVIIERITTEVPPSGFIIIPRVAVLFVVTVQGAVVEDGSIESLRSLRTLYWDTPIQMELSAKNNGTVHMNPTGVIEIRNMFGALLDELPVQDFVVLRESLRTKAFDWKPRFALGRYTASTSLTWNSELMPPVSTSFWVVPVVPVLVILLAIFVVSFLVQFFLTRFEIRKKGAEKSPIQD